VDFAIAAAFIAAMIVARRVTDGEASLPVRWLAAGLPIIVVTVWWLYLAREIRKLDEFQRAVQMRALAIASAITLWITTVWGLVFHFVGGPMLPLVFVAPLGALIFGVIQQVIFFRYR
jgi:hypothetical protein